LEDGRCVGALSAALKWGGAANLVWLGIKATGRYHPEPGSG
jgi:threonine/homoserine/homoserine lactone efflux protein